MSSPDIDRPRPPREQQAWDEIGHTDFKPGMAKCLVLLFIAFICSVPLIQTFTPDEAFHKLVEYEVAESEKGLGLPIRGTVAAISRPPDPNGVYTDFMMRLHLTDIHWPDGHTGDDELLITVVAMKDRVIRPVASGRVGTTLSLHVIPLDEVRTQYEAINGSALDDARYLTMSPYFGSALEGIDHAPSANDFLGTWAGHGQSLPAEARMPVAEGMKAASAKQETSLKRFLGANGHLAQRTRLYEDALDDRSILSLALRPPVQATMIKLGVGNEKAGVGKGGWLFYTPGVHSLTGAGFLDPGQLTRRAREGRTQETAPQPDPRKAIIDFHQQLDTLGIKLIVMPTPVKPSIHPEMLASGLPSDVTIRNESFSGFITELSDAGVLVYDPAPLLMKRKSDGPQYLKTDTHWNPGAMTAVAEELAGVVHDIIGPLPPQEKIVSVAEAATFTQLGDIATMLDLPEEQRVVEPETATVSPVTINKHKPLPPVEGSDVLLLGDSFANIFSLGSMGWGSNAGLSEQLSVFLKRPVDRLSRNDAGAHASREMLIQALKQDVSRLHETKVVIWQFAERELALGDWKTLSLPEIVTRATDIEPAPTNVVQITSSSPDAIRASYAAIVKEAGDATVVKGSENWLFLVNELEHLAGGPFWGKHAESESRDPLFSIMDLNSKLKELGIELVLAPAPPRSVIYADKLLPGLPLIDGIPPRTDPDLQNFYSELRSNGVTVVDVTDAMLAARIDDQTLGPVSCEQDSHWSPRGQLLLADRLAAYAAKHQWHTPDAAITRQPAEELAYTGDLVSLAGLADSPSTTQVTRVTADEAGTIALESDPKSPIILLADSHGLIFSAGGDMHTTGAGLAEQIAAELGKPLDVMARKGSGAGVRRDLARRFIRTPEEAQGRKMLIYCFAARAFTGPDSWKVVPLQKK